METQSASEGPAVQTRMVSLHSLLIILSLALLTGCGNLDPPSVDPDPEAILADVDVDEMPGTKIEKPPNTEAAVPVQNKITREQTLIASLTIFALAVFVGFELITKVPPTLHTPLMSGSNAISGITLVGAALMAGNGVNGWAMFFGIVAVILATINAVGGFMVTDRMLAMFKKK